jgi:hypothetical protein
MNPQQYLLLALTLSMAILWGYAAILWMESRRLQRQERRRS